MNQKILMTPEGLDELKKELEILDKEKKPRVIERLERAREMGDLSENSEYDDAKNELSLVEGRVAELKEIVARATVQKADNKNCQKVGFGCQVRLLREKAEQIFRIVGEREANPIQQKISYNSPLGQALLGKTVGETVSIHAPVGKIDYKIIAIE